MEYFKLQIGCLAVIFFIIFSYYRDAMPLDKCFEIIKNGRENDFDPLLVDIFVEIRPKVEKVYESIYS